MSTGNKVVRMYVQRSIATRYDAPVSKFFPYHSPRLVFSVDGEALINLFGPYDGVGEIDFRFDENGNLLARPEPTRITARSVEGHVDALATTGRKPKSFHPPHGRC